MSNNTTQKWMSFQEMAQHHQATQKMEGEAIVNVLTAISGGKRKRRPKQKPVFSAKAPKKQDVPNQ